jgi:hypothetical protein
MMARRPDGSVTMVGTDGTGHWPGESSVRLDVRPGPSAPTVLAPRSVMVCQLVMSLVMGYMLVSLL